MIRIEPHFKRQMDDFRVPDGDSNGAARHGPSEITQDNGASPTSPCRGNAKTRRFLIFDEPRTGRPRQAQVPQTLVRYRAKPGDGMNLGKVGKQENSPAGYLTRVGHGAIITITAKQPALNFSGNADAVSTATCSFARRRFSCADSTMRCVKRYPSNHHLRPSEASACAVSRTRCSSSTETARRSIQGGPSVTREGGGPWKTQFRPGGVYRLCRSLVNPMFSRTITNHQQSVRNLIDRSLT